MKKIFIVILLAVVGYFVYQYMQSKGMLDENMVAYGKNEYADLSGKEEAYLNGIFNAKDYIVSGQPTIIELYTDSCGGCRQLEEHLKTFLKIRPDVVVKQIRLDDYWKPEEMLANYNINIAKTPHIIIYDAAGKLIAKDDGQEDDSGFNFLYKWMNKEIEMDWERNQKG
jgi:hypothetical protein